MTVMRLWHSADRTGLTVTLLKNRAGLCLRGEADMQNVDDLREAIAALPADVAEVHLELAELRFIDVCSTRELIILAHRPARPLLILHQPPRGLTRLIRLLWPDCCRALESSGGCTECRATTSIQARSVDSRQRNEGDALAEVKPIRPTASQ
jgi:hypothetical protein